MAVIAFLGMGAMGSRMALNLLKAGHQVIVWNRNPDRTLPLVQQGVQVAATPSQAAAQAEFVISMLRDDQASHRVWCDPQDGALLAMPPASIAIECSTLSSEWIDALAQTCQAQQTAFLHAPLAGSRPQAEAGQLAFFVGGELSVFEQSKPILALMGNVHYAGSPRAGAYLKLAINTLFGVQLATLAEIIGVFKAAGFDTARLIELLSTTPVCSPAAKVAANSMLQQNFNPLFPIHLVEKDFSYAVSAAQSVAAASPITAATWQVYQQSAMAGFGEDNITGVVQLYSR